MLLELDQVMAKVAADSQETVSGPMAFLEIASADDGVVSTGASQPAAESQENLVSIEQSSPLVLFASAGEASQPANDASVESDKLPDEVRHKNGETVTSDWREEYPYNEPEPIRGGAVSFSVIGSNIMILALSTNIGGIF